MAEGGDAHGGDSEGIKRMEGPDVADEHDELDRLLEHFDGRIQRRSEVEQGHARPPAWVMKGRGGLTGSAVCGGRDLATMED